MESRRSASDPHLFPAAPGASDSRGGPFVYLGVEIPAPLRPVVARHHTHLTALLASLRDAGIDEAAISGSVEGLIGHYRAELVAAIAVRSPETIHG